MHSNKSAAISIDHNFDTVNRQNTIQSDTCKPADITVIIVEQAMNFYFDVQNLTSFWLYDIVSQSEFGYKKRPAYSKSFVWNLVNMLFI